MRNGSSSDSLLLLQHLSEADSAAESEADAPQEEAKAEEAKAEEPEAEEAKAEEAKAEAEAEEAEEPEAKAEEHANSKLGFLQKVVTLECFFGGSDCLFRDKQSMMQGKVTEFAKKRFEDGSPHVDQYLSQVSSQVNNDLQASATLKNLNSVDQKVSKN